MLDSDKLGTIDAEPEHKPRRRRRRADGDSKQAPKARPKAKRSKKGADGTLSLLVDYMSVGIGDETARLGAKISRGQLTLSQADSYLCGRRLSGTVKVQGHGVDPNQQELFEGVHPEITAVFDVKRFSVATDYLSFGLTFALAEIDVRDLANFAKKEGLLTITGVDVIPSNTGEVDD